MRMIRADGDYSPDEAGKGLALPMVAATAGKKGDGVDLSDLPWDLSRGKVGDSDRARFPMLWAHDFTGSNLPIGVVDVGVGEDGTSLSDSFAIFDPDDELAVKIERKFRSPVGGLDSFSISWDEVDEDGLLARKSNKPAVANQLLEVSAVPIPLDKDATLRTDGPAIHALRALHADLGTRLREAGSEPDASGTSPTAPDSSPALPSQANDPGDASPPDEDSWCTCAAAMVDVFDRGSDDSDEKRRRAYNALLPTYRRLAKEPPEWVGGDELRALDDDNWRALFLAGEIEATGQRAGAELSARNVRDLSDAVADIQAGVNRIESLLERVADRNQDPAGGEIEEQGDTERALSELSGWLDARLDGEEAPDDPAD